MAKYLPSREAARLVFLKPLFIEIEKNNCFSITHEMISTKSERKPLKKYEFIDRSNDA